MSMYTPLNGGWNEKKQTVCIKSKSMVGDYRSNPLETSKYLNCFYL